jgi:NOL1/NOP2/fmu family ribosome biogenesis protein
MTASIEVDKLTALEYLRKQEISIDSNYKGWVLLSYQQIKLGWIKLLSNRINNYYPKEWRIINK